MRQGLRNKTKKNQNMGLNITSLMDVLTIILIFLLVNYSDVEDVQDIPDFISMPTISTNPDLELAEDIKVNIGQGRIALQGEVVTYRSFEKEKDIVVQRFSRILEDIQAQRRALGKNMKISIRADQNVPYEVIDELLVGAGSVGVTQIDLLAMAKGE